MNICLNPTSEYFKIQFAEPQIRLLYIVGLPTADCIKLMLNRKIENKEGWVLVDRRNTLEEWKRIYCYGIEFNADGVIELDYKDDPNNVISVTHPFKAVFHYHVGYAPRVEAFFYFIMAICLCLALYLMIYNLLIL